MSDARRNAQEALAEAKALNRYAPSRLVLAKLVVATEALLAEERATPPQLVEGEPGHESCVGCGRPVAPALPPAVREAAEGYERARVAAVSCGCDRTEDEPLCIHDSEEDEAARFVACTVVATLAPAPQPAASGVQEEEHGR